MKSSNQSVALFIGMLAAAVISVAGCASTGIQRSEAATTSMTTMDSDIKLAVVQIDATGASLDELTKPENSDVQKAFYLYSDNVSIIENMQKDFDKHADEMNARGRDYFEEWQKEGDKYKNQKIQELSEERRSELGGIYGEIATNSIGVKDDFNTYVSDLKEIQNYLSNDLTPKGIEAIAPISRKVANDGDQLKYSLGNIQTAIKRASAEMSQSAN